MKTMRLEKAEDGFAILTLDAEGSMNVVNDAFIADMEAATKQIVADESIKGVILTSAKNCLLYTSPSPRDMRRSRMPSSA